MASISLADEARADPRFVILGKKLGTSRFDARGRTEELWAYCTDKQIYYLTKEVIDVLADFEGFAEIISSPEVGLAEVCEQGFRIKGTRGRIEWLKKLRKNSQKGGERTRANWQAKRLAKQGPEGRPSLGPSSTASTTIQKKNTAQRERRANWKSEFDLEAAYKAYPRKQGKSRGLKRLAGEIKTFDDYQALLKAIEHYKRSDDVSRGFIKHFSTFASEWRDWLDPDAGTAQAPLGSPAINTKPLSLEDIK